ncbi:ergothioneine biosynthesis protein EgtB [Blastopirellula sp. J2-11]|uniref:ergothioneine biosynthesis protein EgtB n=1 Tax=Blastopirellula sp. J2-11 TaxID=2943192 RepID=UPI0021C9655D|nr:ergothioneine biosynthesis protein EgtB [Blastopirellula sp. J2-11]UUO04753.1 ergothioneine biosynthesis protein EgtB [Blastopirellula sp. J2-11]
MSTDVDTRLESLMRQFREVRQRSERIVAPLEVEDYVVQSMEDASPIKWHLAHTTWFFETFVLQPSIAGYVSPWPQFEYLFNSYYNTVGRPFPRSQRGLLSRPTVDEVLQYRRYVEERIDELATSIEAKLLAVIELGVHHEQQHQELMLTDLKHAFSCNPLCPAYVDQAAIRDTATAELRWIAYEGGICSIGYDGNQFCYDNEQPAHQTLLEPYVLASRLVTCGEYLKFIADGGYQDPQWWLSDGWNFLQSQQVVAPLYWRSEGEQWLLLTLGGLSPISPAQPVHHVSYYEADAFARWSGNRLPTEQEWEAAAQSELASQDSIHGVFLESEEFRPLPASLDDTDPMQQLFGDVWQWTASPYTAYPRYRASAGALGEYNGKFMCNQFVLRGGSCVTPQSHIRATYRNFFGPNKRWQFSGIRLAKSI